MKKLFFLFAAILVWQVSSANNVKLTNISVINNGANTAKIIEFDLSWENSWRTSSTNNWDGVWVFFKIKDNNGLWYPLRFTGTNNIMPTGATFNIGNSGPGAQGVGIFIYRAANGFGTATYTDIRAGIQSYPGTFEVRGFAVEMVYIPQGNFYLGDSIANTFTYRKGTTAAAPYQVTTNGVGITLGNTGGSLFDPKTSYTGTLTGFPTGYQAFWMMKYELSRGAFRDFLNTLSYGQQTNLFLNTSPPNSAANTRISVYGVPPGIFNDDIEIVTSGVDNTVPAIVGVDYNYNNIYNEASDAEWTPAIGINWIHAAAYLDWSGLRPMTEMELEKSCRGPIYPIQGEYAWGEATYDTTAPIIINHSTISESVSNASSVVGNMVVGGFLKLRGGIYANAISTRVSSGAGYYGAMELSGNFYELCVTTANVAGRSFTGRHGDGLLTVNGYANENHWPGLNGSTDTTLAIAVYDGGLGVRTNAGLIERGSYWGGGSQSAQVSFRSLFLSQALNNIAPVCCAATGRTQGIRGVRDAN